MDLLILQRTLDKLQQQMVLTEPQPFRKNPCLTLLQSVGKKGGQKEREKDKKEVEKKGKGKEGEGNEDGECRGVKTDQTKGMKEEKKKRKHYCECVRRERVDTEEGM